MRTSLQKQIRPGVRRFAAFGATFAAMLALNWTPAEPWAPSRAMLQAAAEWPPTAPLIHGAIQMLNEEMYMILGGHPWH